MSYRRGQRQLRNPLRCLCCLLFNYNPLAVGLPNAVVFLGSSHMLLSFVRLSVDGKLPAQDFVCGRIGRCCHVGVVEPYAGLAFQS